jgi:hypothetical protein
MLGAALLVVLLAGLNALRGAGNQWLRFVIAGVSGAAAYAYGASALVACIQALGVWVFLIQPWGRWYTLNHVSRSDLGPPSPYEVVVEEFGGSQDAVCWAISAALFSLPLVILVSPLWALLCVAVPAVYAAAWKLSVGGRFWGPIRYGEAATGAVLALLSVVSYAAAPSATLAFLGFK